MGIDSYFVYLLVSFGYIASPGPAVFIAINGGATIGVKNTAATLLGNSVGLGIIALVSALGLGMVIHGSPPLTLAVKLLGASWLVYIGMKMILADPSQAMERNKKTSVNGHETSLTRFRSGLLLALTNPKPMIFFMSIYPQFIVDNGERGQQFALLGITFMLLSFILLNAYSLFSSMTIGKILSTQRIRAFNLLFGIVLILLALFLVKPVVFNMWN